MNYGYDDTCNGWKPGKRKELVKALLPLVQQFNKDNPGVEAYLQEGGMYGPSSIRVRHITHAPEKAIQNLVSQMDSTYEEVMDYVFDPEMTSEDHVQEFETTGMTVLTLDNPAVLEDTLHQILGD